MKNFIKKSILFSFMFTAPQALGISVFGTINNLKAAYIKLAQEQNQEPQSYFLQRLIRNCSEPKLQNWLKNCHILRLGTKEQILTRAITEQHEDAIKFLMPFYSKEERGEFLLLAINLQKLESIETLLKHKISEKHLWKGLHVTTSTKQRIISYLQHEEIITLLLSHMKPLTLTESLTEDFLNLSGDDTSLAYTSLKNLTKKQLPANVKNILAKALVKTNNQFAEYFLPSLVNTHDVYIYDSKELQMNAQAQPGISNRTLKKIAQHNQSYETGALLAEKLYCNKTQQFHTVDPSIITIKPEQNKDDFYANYIKLCKDKGNQKLQDSTACIAHNMLLKRALAAKLTHPPKKADGQSDYHNYNPCLDLPYDLLKANMMQRVCEHEKELLAQGFQTFYHGRSWEWNFANDMWKIVQALNNKSKQLPETIALRYRSGQDSNDELLEYRKDLLENGPHNYSGTGTNRSGKDAEVVCMNRTIVANSNYSAICTGSYYLHNRCMAPTGEALRFVEKMFNENKLESVYQTFKNEIEQLALAHQQTSDRGELLCIAINKRYINDMVYVSDGYAQNDQSTTASDFLKTLESKTKNNRFYVEDDCKYFCLAVSDIPGEYGTKYKITSLHTADPEKYSSYCNERDALFTRMQQA